jgi:hypothetical protein
VRPVLASALIGLSLWWITTAVDKHDIVAGPYVTEDQCRQALPSIEKAYPNLQLHCENV